MLSIGQTMTTRGKRLAVFRAVLIPLLFAAVAVFRTFHEATTSANDSAHAALTAEIERQLAAIPPGQQYPESLSQLRLTYPDGGTTSLLSHFTYRSAGTNCTLRTVLRSHEIVRSFP
jgi:hypothetical protein